MVVLSTINREVASLQVMASLNPCLEDALVVRSNVHSSRFVQHYLYLERPALAQAIPKVAGVIASDRIAALTNPTQSA